MKLKEKGAAVLAVASVVASFLGGSAWAQTGFGEPKNSAVRERSDPEYQAQGVPFGGFRLYPELTFSGEYDDNVFAVETDQDEDFVGAVGVNLRYASQWSSHALNFTAGGKGRLYSEFSDANTEEYNFGVDGRLDIDRSAFLTASVAIADLNEPFSDRPSLAPTVDPVSYSTVAFNASLSKTFNRIKLTSKSSVMQYDYEDGVLVGGGVLEQDGRDRVVTEFGIRSDYSISPDSAIFVDVRANQREYDLSPPEVTTDRNSDGYEVLVGSTFDVTNLVRGEIGVGYISQSFDAVSGDDVSGFGVRSRLDWFPDELVTVGVTAVRAVQDAAVPGSAGYLATDFGATVDYEYRRNIILGAKASYGQDDYGALDRDDTRWQASASVDYAIDRATALFGSVLHTDTDSSGADANRSFAVNRVTVGVKFRR